MKAVKARTRIQVNNVLFLTDFSEAAAASIPYAAEVAKRFGAKLYALHVQTPVVNPMTEPATGRPLKRARRQKRRSSERPCSIHFRVCNRK